jgi:3-oxoacyl-[acyl-carrier protein] reductase
VSSKPTKPEECVALVTGGSRGIGRAIASRLAADGAQVVLTARSEETARRVADELSAEGGRLRGVALDISDDSSVEGAVGALLDDYAKIPVLVNNAGITCDNLLLRMKIDDWDRVLQTNLTGAYRMCRALVPSMVRGRYGRIVNVSSVVATVGNPGQANYCAAKAGIEGMSRSLARELASRNITVNCVAPGFIDTDMTRELPEEARKKLLAEIPLRRLGSGDDVAAAVSFLVGPGGDYITGTTLHVNGGMYM